MSCLRVAVAHRGSRSADADFAPVMVAGVDVVVVSKAERVKRRHADEVAALKRDRALLVAYNRQLESQLRRPRWWVRWRRRR